MFSKSMSGKRDRTADLHDRTFFFIFMSHRPSVFCHGNDLLCWLTWTRIFHSKKWVSDRLIHQRKTTGYELHGRCQISEPAIGIRIVFEQTAQGASFSCQRTIHPQPLV